MRILIVLSIALFTIFFNNCKNASTTDKEGNVKDELIDFLEDSTSIFTGVTHFEVSGELQGTDAYINFYSISEETFRLAFNKNDKDIRFFNRKFKLNENSGLENSFREDTVLKLGKGINQKSFVDLKKSMHHRAQKYFLEDKIGGLFVVKWIRFEDAGVMFLNAKTMQEELSLDGLSVYTNSKDSLILYSSPMRDVYNEKESFCLMQIGADNSVDTLLNTKTNWFPDFAFFDKEQPSIYYIHCYYEDYELKSTFAKMDYKLF